MSVSKNILGVVPIAMSAGLAMSMMPKKKEKFNPIKTGVKAVVGISLIGATSNAIASMD